MKFRGAGACDEIVNNGLMEITTAQSSCFQRLAEKDEIERLQSAVCGIAAD